MFLAASAALQYGSMERTTNLISVAVKENVRNTLISPFATLLLLLFFIFHSIQLYSVSRTDTDCVNSNRNCELQMTNEPIATGIVIL